MQTFLPYADIPRSVKALDWRRLGKQRVEAYQILRILREERTSSGWVNHPATRMWRGYDDALASYMNECIVEWILRGYKNNMQMAPHKENYRLPYWFGDEAFHASHRSNLLRKEPSFYGQYGWIEPPDLPYVWPLGTWYDRESAQR